MAENTHTFGTLYDAYKAGKLSRRDFINRATALGVGFPVVAFLLRTVDARAAAPDAKTIHIGSRLQDAPNEVPVVGAEGKTRGQDGELRLLQWQAPTMLSAHYSTGTKDFLAADLVTEPLMRYLPDGTLIPTLVKEVPSVENGLLAEDLTQVTFNLLEGVVWSDGEPFTAEDVVFTHNLILDSVNTDSISVNYEVWKPITSAEAVDELTVKMTFAEPNVNWYVPFTGGIYGPIYPKHYIEANGGVEVMLNNPIGTGPYKVDSFSPGDQVIYSANENFRFPDKPYFATVNLKGGGEAASAAQAVLQTGEWDHAWNLQVEPAILRNYEEGGQGRLKVIQGTNVERININFSDPNAEGPGGQRSYWGNPHPFLTDIEVRRAMNLAVNRDLIANEFYFGEQGEPATANILVGVPAFESPNTSYEFDLDQANQILDDAGWARSGDIREKDGVQLSISYATSINLVRQKTQAVVKQGLEEIGFQVSLQQVDSGVFFDGSAGNPQNINHMYVDVNMYTNGASSPTPVDYMIGWYAGEDNVNVAQQSNSWNGQNYQRYINPEYDALFEELRFVTDAERAAELLIQLNDILINDVVLIPEVNRAADKYAMHESLFHEDEDNVLLGPFELNYWNIENWNRSSPVDR
jgi:peptide/nickel transport system substrate-binding protein